MSHPLDRHDKPPDLGSKPRVIRKGVIASGVLIVLAVGACALWEKDILHRWFGPPPVVMTESFADQAGSATFDHTAFDRLLEQYVTSDGWVDYTALGQHAQLLDQYITSLASAPIDQLGRDQRLALLINAYNAFTLRLILDHYPVTSIKDIPAAKRWDDARWRLGGERVSLNQIEHERIRPHFIEPRIHFALVCAAVGCPPLRNEAYHADRLEDQLDSQTRYVHRHDRWFRFDPSDPKRISLTRLYRWYRGDFEPSAGSVLGFVARYVPQVRRALDDRQAPDIVWLEYDWSLNDRRQAP